MGSTPPSTSPTSNIAATTMKRQRVPHQTQHPIAEAYAAVGDVMFDPRRPYQSDADGGGRDDDDDPTTSMPLHSMTSGGGRPASQRPRNVLEAQVQAGDTLQAIAIRYSCSVADIKRLNKIERDYEIHAHKTLRVPLTADNILADHLLLSGDPIPSTSHNTHHHTDSVLAALASQTMSASALPTVKFISTEPSINEIILNTTLVSNQYTDGVGVDPTFEDDHLSAEQTLLINDDDVRQPRPIQAAGGLRAQDLSCSGSDCDISWLCLFVCILAMCFAIPLIYVFWIAEHHVDTDEALHGVSTARNEHVDGGGL